MESKLWAEQGIASLHPSTITWGFLHFFFFFTGQKNPFFFPSSSGKVKNATIPAAGPDSFTLLCANKIPCLLPCTQTWEHLAVLVEAKFSDHLTESADESPEGLSLLCSVLPRALGALLHLHVPSAPALEMSEANRYHPALAVLGERGYLVGQCSLLGQTCLLKVAFSLVRYQDTIFSVSPSPWLQRFQGWISIISPHLGVLTSSHPYPGL